MLAFDKNMSVLTWSWWCTWGFWHFWMWCCSRGWVALFVLKECISLLSSFTKVKWKKQN